MKITPPIPVGEVKSNAERVLHERLKVVAMPGWVAVHSLLLADHPYKRWGEIDFLLVGPQGLLALEVKGGRVACVDGIWEFTDRSGVIHRKSESPMRQASSGLMALRDWLRDQLPHLLVDRISFGWGVGFPDIEFHQTSPEWDPRCVGDRRYVGDPPRLERWLRALTSHWALHNDRPNELSADEVLQLLRVIRPEFEMVPSLATMVSRAIERSNRLTLNQLEVLDAVLDNKRLLILGGAGTGKTFVAAELARRRLADHPSETLAIAVPWEPAALPFAGAVPASVDVLVGEDVGGGRYDFLIADEAQDFMTESGITYLDALVTGGLERGQWAAFVDSNAQRGIRRAFEPAAYALLSEADPTKLTLKRNLRNSHEIVAYVADATGADIGIAGGGHGPDVALDLIDDDAAFGVQAARILTGMRREGIRPEEIVVLTWLDPTEAAAAIQDNPWPALAAQGTTDLLAHEGVIRVCRPADFQGLEAAHVVLGPVPAGDLQLERSETYVGATRARADLRFVATREAMTALAARANQREDVE